MSECIICGGRLYDDKTLYDDRYGYPGYSRLFRCKDCGHKSLDAEFSGETLARLYSDYYPRSEFKIEDYKPHEEAQGFRAWLDGEYYAAFRWVPKNVRVLDIGCGFGETLGYHKARGCDVHGVEADRNISRVAEKFGYKVHVGLFDPELYEPGFFDYVTMDQVIEHTKDPVTTLKGVARVLKPGGVAILSMPNSKGWGARVFGRKWINWHAPYHIQHFTAKSMRIAAEKAGLRIEQYRTITFSKWLHYQWMHLITYPKEGEASAFWTAKAKFYGKQVLYVKLFDFMHKSKIDHFITRFFDSLKIGDNFIFILRKAQ